MRFSIARVLASFGYRVCDGCMFVLACCLSSAFDKGRSYSFYSSDSTVCFCWLLVPCFCVCVFLVLTVSSYFVDFNLWKFSEAKVKGGFPWREISRVHLPGDWRLSWPLEPLETQLSAWGFLDLKSFLATNLCKGWLVSMTSWRFRDLPTSLSTTIETGSCV